MDAGEQSAIDHASTTINKETHKEKTREKTRERRGEES
jgi:hypothetical protein